MNLLCRRSEHKKSSRWLKRDNQTIVEYVFEHLLDEEFVKSGTGKYVSFIKGLN